jgi:tetratricopeptide (TPR) repeat protein
MNSPTRQSLFSSLRRAIKPFGAVTAATVALSLSFSNTVAWAGDPFRNSNPHAIGDRTEAAFESLFKDGNYTLAKQQLIAAEATEASDPLVHAMLASFAFLEGDLDALNQRAQLTQAKAEALMATDPLRGHLYTAVGIFLEGAYLVETQGVARATPAALMMLQQVFSHMDQAERLSSSDPELNLLKGYMDLMLAVNLPFADPEDAIERLEAYGSPSYLSYRGIALAYRDLDQLDQAMTAVDKALTAAPNNPELLYLKAQLYVRKGMNGESLKLFDQALAYQTQLPSVISRQITRERCLASGLPGSECSAQATQRN